MVGDSLGGGLKKTAAISRRQYVDDFLTAEVQRIQNEGQNAASKRNGLRNITIQPEDAKRIALKQLGMFSGKPMKGNAPLYLDDKQKDMIYNSLARKRAQSIHDSVHSARGSNEGKKMLTDMGLSKRATVDEIAAALGYEA